MDHHAAFSTPKKGNELTTVFAKLKPSVTKYIPQVKLNVFPSILGEKVTDECDLPSGILEHDRSQVALFSFIGKGQSCPLQSKCSLSNYY